MLTYSRTRLAVLCIVFFCFINSCSETEPTTEEVLLEGRWYSSSQIAQGAQVFLQHCAQCHGDNAQGTVTDWQRRLEDGKFPPPPLNGSAHAWHHPLSVLLQVINEGGQALGGSMPAFASVINQQEKLAAVAYFQSFWSDEIYANWIQMGGEN